MNRKKRPVTLDEIKLDDDPEVDAVLKGMSAVVLWVDDEDANGVTVTIVKNKNGPTGKVVKLRWDELALLYTKYNVKT